MATEVVLHFGNGTFVTIGVPEDDVDEALKAAQDYVMDNAWLTVYEREGNGAGLKELGHRRLDET